MDVDEQTTTNIEKSIKNKDISGSKLNRLNHHFKSQNDKGSTSQNQPKREGAGSKK